MIESVEHFFSFLSQTQTNQFTTQENETKKDNFQFFHDWMMEKRKCRFCDPQIIADGKYDGSIVTCSSCGTSYRWNVLMKIWEKVKK